MTKNVIGDSAAGIAGRNEVANGNWYMEDCNNFGAIDGRRTGGIIGCLKYNGGTLYNCSNYGAVKGSSDPVSYTHLDVYKRQVRCRQRQASVQHPV